MCVCVSDVMDSLYEGGQSLTHHHHIIHRPHGVVPAVTENTSHQNWQLFDCLVIPANNLQQQVPPRKNPNQPDHSHTSRPVISRPDHFH